MKLRTAKNSQSDFENFVRLHEDLGTTQICILEKSSEPVNIDELEYKRLLYFLENFDWEVLRYTKEEFEFDTSHKSILLAEHDGKIIGAIQFFKIDAKRYKLAEWTIDKEYLYLKEEIWNVFIAFFKKEHKGIEELDVCLPSTNSVVTWFKEHGFSDKGYHFYTLYLKSQK